MKYTPVDSNTRFRRGSNTGERYDLPFVQPGDILEGAEIFTATEELRNEYGVYQMIGDKWLHVLTVNGQVRDGWVAIVNKGEVICRELPDTPPTSVFPDRFVLTDPATGASADYVRIVK